MKYKDPKNGTLVFGSSYMGGGYWPEPADEELPLKHLFVFHVFLGVLAFRVYLWFEVSGFRAFGAFRVLRFRI